MALPVGSALRMAQRKWPDRPHWSYGMTVLGADGEGTWAAVPRGTPARRGGGPVRRLAGFVVLVPPGDPWVVEFNVDHPEVAVYVNIGTVPRIARGEVVQVDLDLDVVLRRDGTVVVEDRDEFLANAVHYPDDLVELAEDAAVRAAARLRDEADPFGARPWLARIAEPRAE